MIWVAWGIDVVTLAAFLFAMRGWKQSLDGWRVAQNGWRDACLVVADAVDLSSTTDASGVLPDGVSRG